MQVAAQHPSANTPEQDFASAGDGHRIPYSVWPAADGKQPQAVVHICHGMAEHRHRYDELAQYLAGAGLVTVAHDHRGHGEAAQKQDLGLYAETDGWQKVTGDVATMQKLISERWPDLPIILLGHSMGSFISQGYLISHRPEPNLTGLILSGSSRDSRGRLQALHLLVRVLQWRQGPRARSKLIHDMTFGAFAKSVQPARTPFDWLSTDAAAVDAYIDDPLCGFDCTLQLWNDLGQGLLAINRLEALKKVPRDLPIFILSGEQDAVGHFGEGPRALASAYRNSGHSEVLLRLYQGLRHEPFHEKKKDQVFRDLLFWIQSRLACGAD